MSLDNTLALRLANSGLPNIKTTIHDKEDLPGSQYPLNFYEQLIQDLFNQNEFTQGQLPFIATFIATDKPSIALKVAEKITHATTKIAVLGKIAEKCITSDPSRIASIVDKMVQFKDKELSSNFRLDAILDVLKKLALVDLRLAQEILNKLNDDILKYSFHFKAAHKMASVNPVSKKAEALSLLEELIAYSNTHPEESDLNGKIKFLALTAKELYPFDAKRSEQIWSEAIKLSKEIPEPKLKKEVQSDLLNDLVCCFPEKIFEITGQIKETDEEVSDDPRKIEQQIADFAEKYLRHEFPQAYSNYLCHEAEKFLSAYPNYPRQAEFLLVRAGFSDFKDDSVKDRVVKNGKVHIEITKKMAALNPEKAVEYIKNHIIINLYKEMRKLFIFLVKRNSSNPDLAYSFFENEIIPKHDVFLELNYKMYSQIAKGAFKTFSQVPEKIYELAQKTHHVCKAALILEVLDHCELPDLHSNVTYKLLRKLNISAAA